MAVQRPGIPSVDASMPQGLTSILQALKDNVEISNGVRSPGQQVGAGVGYDGWKRRSFTLGMAIAAGLITEAQAMDLYNNQP